ncbi:MAG: peptidoglycan DD-metalloendopeptidase family protein [Pleurocapsa sp.]
MSFLQQIESFSSTEKAYKPITMLGLTLSLSSTSLLLPSFHQSAVAVDSIPQHNSLNTLQPQPLLNLMEQVASRLFPHLVTELPLTPSVRSNLSNNYAIGGERPPKPTNSIAQLSPLTLAKATIDSPSILQIYRVKPGDTLSKIARQYGISTEALLAINPIENPDLISIGRVLNIPQITPETAIATQTVLTSPLSISPQILPSLQQPKVVEPNLTVASQKSNDTTDNPYIERLRTDIDRIRDRYLDVLTSAPDGDAGSYRYQQQLHSDRSNNKISSLQSASSSLSDRDFSFRDLPTAESPTKLETGKASLNNSQNSLMEKDYVNVAPSNTSNYQTLLPTTTTATILQPELPPLPDSDQYLPTIFDGYQWPAQGTLTSGYGWRWGRMHRGIDIAAPIGTPIVAAASGEVIFSGWNSGGYGNLIKLRHPDSSVTLYAHNNKNLVTKGQQVVQGQQIAEMGSTGYSTGPHLHFEIHPNGDSAVDPIAFLPQER